MLLSTLQGTRSCVTAAWNGSTIHQRLQSTLMTWLATADPALTSGASTNHTFLTVEHYKASRSQEYNWSCNECLFFRTSGELCFLICRVKSRLLLGSKYIHPWKRLLQSIFMYTLLVPWPPHCSIAVESWTHWFIVWILAGVGVKVTGSWKMILIKFLQAINPSITLSLREATRWSKNWGHGVADWLSNDMSVGVPSEE
jgi:hypothetical protein